MVSLTERVFFTKRKEWKNCRKEAYVLRIREREGTHSIREKSPQHQVSRSGRHIAFVHVTVQTHKQLVPTPLLLKLANGKFHAHVSCHLTSCFHSPTSRLEIPAGVVSLFCWRGVCSPERQMTQSWTRIHIAAPQSWAHGQDSTMQLSQSHSDWKEPAKG